MGKVLIAYNNDSETVLHDFFESCADEAKQICFDNDIEYSSVCPPDFNEQNVISVMPEQHLCFLASHGDADGIYNEKEEPVVSICTTNYNFNGKGFYSVACSCAQNLYPHINAMGARLFVGYKDILRVKGELGPFVNSAMAGLKSFLAGDSAKEAKDKMLAEYDNQIASLEGTNHWAAKFLVHNKEALVFNGEETLTFLDLQ